MTLLPPRAKWEVAKVMTFGARKYGKENYLAGEGFEWRRIMDAVERHQEQWKMGIDTDEESGLPHLAHAAAGLLMLLESVMTNKGRDDRWKDE